MLRNSSLFTNAIKADVRKIHARVTINNIVYDESVINNIDFDSSALAGEQFEIGSTTAASVKIEFSKVIDTIVALDKVVVELGVKRDDFPQILKNKTNVQVGNMRMGTRLNLWNSTEDIEYSLLGEFYISDHVDINYNDKITTIECKDKMIYLEGDFESELSYPADARNVIVEIANKAGVEIDISNIEELETLDIGEIKDYSYREALSFIAQLFVGYVSFNRRGLLQIKKLKDSNYQISMNEYYSKGLQKNSMRYKIQGITCSVPSDEEAEELFIGNKKGIQLSIENPIMTQELLNNLFTELQKINYYPFDLNWRGNPAIEAGELITVHDAEGNQLKVPNLNYRIKYNGGLSAESSADTKSRSNIVIGGRKTLQQQIRTSNRRLKETANELRQDLLDAQGRITGNQGGYVVQRLDEDGKPYEILIMDTEDINSAKNVIRLNQQGIGFSQNGYNGPFGVAITIEGNVVADFISSGTLNADLIKAGTLSDTQGNTSLDLLNGLMKFSHDDGSYTQIGKDGLERLESGAVRPYQYRTYVGEVSGAGDILSGDTRVQLPDDFKGKDFNVVVSFKGYRLASGSGDTYEMDYMNIGSVELFKNEGAFSFWSSFSTYKYTLSLVPTIPTINNKGVYVKGLDFSNLIGKGFIITISYVATY